MLLNRLMTNRRWRRAEIDWDEDCGELRVLQVGHRDTFYE